jgi:hypothetical protein
VSRGAQEPSTEDGLSTWEVVEEHFFQQQLCWHFYKNKFGSVRAVRKGDVHRPKPPDKRGRA